jgi:hypothetical protein
VVSRRKIYGVVEGFLPETNGQWRRGMVVAAIWGVGGHREVEKAIWGGFCDGWSWFWEVVDDALILWLHVCVFFICQYCMLNTN